MAEKLTATDYAGWIPARHVADKFLALPNFQVAVNSLGDRLRVGLAHAMAGYMAVNLGRADRGPIQIPMYHWKEIKALARDDIWQTGQVTIWVRERERSEPVRYDYHDVRFEPSSLGEMLAAMAPAPAPPLVFPGGKTHIDEDYDAAAMAPINTGGAPRKVFWDDLWIAIFADIWNNKLVPTKQSDIEEAMLDWAEKRGHKLGETTVKKPAQKLFKAYKTWV